MTEPRAGLKRGYYLLNTDGGMASNGRAQSECLAEHWRSQVALRPVSNS